VGEGVCECRLSYYSVTRYVRVVVDDRTLCHDLCVCIHCVGPFSTALKMHGYCF